VQFNCFFWYNFWQAVIVIVIVIAQFDSRTKETVMAFRLTQITPALRACLARIQRIKRYSRKAQSLATVVLGFLLVLPAASVSANSDGDYTGRRVEAVRVVFDNAAIENPTYRDATLQAFAIYPGSYFDTMRSQLMLNKVKRLKFVGNAEYQTQTSASGDVEIIVKVTLSDLAKPLGEQGIGWLADRTWKDFPVLYADDKTVLRAKLENKSMLFSNTNAFFGRPEILTSGNPLALAPSGKQGTDTWLESSVEAGLYGLSALTEHISVFGAGSYISSGSWGPELFTDVSRTHGHVEDAYLGLIGTNTTPQGGIRQMSLLYGRKSFQVDNGMILRLSSANGGARAALQSNPRNAAEQLMHAQFIYDAHKLDVFRLNPDELEELDTKTIVNGINYEGRLSPQLRLGAMLLEIPSSNAAYYSNSAVYSRAGLRVADIRLSLDAPLTGSGPYARAELARQTHKDFDMDARAGYVEAGYQFHDKPWRPTFSYRYSYFSGDNPNTATFERWDPLFAGGGGDEWVQGLNQYKVVQTSNVIAHRFMARLQASPRWELTPQFWIFKADSLNNLGGAQALSTYTDKDLGKEINLTARYVASPNLIFVFSTAYTQPGLAIRQALNYDYKNWFSASALMIARF
jgi:hypothetical protein